MDLLENMVICIAHEYSPNLLPDKSSKVQNPFLTLEPMSCKYARNQFPWGMFGNHMPTEICWLQLYPRDITLLRLVKLYLYLYLYIYLYITFLNWKDMEIQDMPDWTPSHQT